ncbi:MAG: ComEA family DNA-binding protein [Candidatus Korobacteraceae bacterium]
MEPIDLNTAPPNRLTQLPGVSKDIAYNIVRHRERHGWFTAWEEVATVSGFPVERLEEIKVRAVLGCPEDRPRQSQTECVPPRHVSEETLQRKQPGTAGYTKSIRAGRRTSKFHNTPDRKR